jgi:hypothetical protein
MEGDKKEMKKIIMTCLIISIFLGAMSASAGEICVDVAGTIPNGTCNVKCEMVYPNKEYVGELTYYSHSLHGPTFTDLKVPGIYRFYAYSDEKWGDILQLSVHGIPRFVFLTNNDVDKLVNAWLVPGLI